MEEYDYINEKDMHIAELKEIAGETGFMRGPEFVPTPMNTPIMLPNKMRRGPITIGKVTPGSKEDIMNRCTAREYYVLQHASWRNSREVIEEFIGILQRLIDEGCFGEKMPEGPMQMCTPDPNGSGWSPIPPTVPGPFGYGFPRRTTQWDIGNGNKLPSNPNPEIKEEDKKECKKDCKKDDCKCEKATEEEQKKESVSEVIAAFKENKNKNKYSKEDLDRIFNNYSGPTVITVKTLANPGDARDMAYKGFGDDDKCISIDIESRVERKNNKNDK